MSRHLVALWIVMVRGGKCRRKTLVIGKRVWFSIRLPLCPQKPHWRTATTLPPRRTPPPIPPPLCSTAGVTTWARRVEGSPSRSSVTMATTATWATASPSRGRSQIYDRTGQSVDRCVNCSLIDLSSGIPPFDGMGCVTASRSLCLHPPGAETCHTHQIFLSLASSSSLSTRPCRCCCAPSTQPSRGLRRTCSKRSFWWTTTAAAVRIIKCRRNLTFALCGKPAPALLDLQPQTQSSFITPSIHRGQSIRGGMKRCIPFW